jgi:hypothetical protein
MDKPSFKSHRLPYRQQWFKTYSKYNVDSNRYLNVHGMQSSRVVGSIEGINKLTTNYTVPNKLEKTT